MSSRWESLGNSEVRIKIKRKSERVIEFEIEEKGIGKGI